ncbi:hypothetical protein JHK87_034709 [Glycine soja]|nr:hypothetical protein JHK87_034709 [Glycine soja]
MTPQFAASHSFFRVPPTSPSLRFTRNKDLIPERYTIINRKKNHAITAFAGNSLGKSAIQLNAASSPLFADKEAHLSLKLPMSRKSNTTIRQAFIYHSSGFRIPSNAEKPEWWWRTLSCVPYLSCQPITKLVPYAILQCGYCMGGKKQGLAPYLQIPFNDGNATGTCSADSVDFKQFPATYTLQGNFGDVLLGWCGVDIYFCNNKVHKVCTSGYIFPVPCNYAKRSPSYAPHRSGTYAVATPMNLVNPQPFTSVILTVHHILLFLVSLL